MKTEKIKSQFLRDQSRFVSAGLLKKEEANLLARGCESNRPLYTKEYANAVGNAVSNLVSKPEIGLTLMNELLLNYDNRDKIYDFVSGTKSLIRHLDSEELFVRDLAVVVCARAFSTTSSSLKGDDSSQFLEYLTYIADLLSRKTESRRTALRACTVILGNKYLRSRFISHPRTCRLLVGLLSSRQGDIGELQQVLYDATFCLWAISYDPASYPIFADTEAVSLLVRVSLTAKDKVVRVGLSTLRNLLGKTSPSGKNFNEQMIDSDVLTVLAEIAVRQWSNADRDREDAMEDLKILTVELQKNVRVLSSFDRYKIELQTGHLKRGFIHSERFWSENARKFEYKNFQLIRELIALLDDPTSDAATIAVACYDLGEFARFYESGRSVIVHHKGKSKLMQLVEHKDDEVKKEALQASAKLLISNWEYVSAS